MPDQREEYFQTASEKYPIEKTRASTQSTFGEELGEAHFCSAPPARGALQVTVYMRECARSRSNAMRAPEMRKKLNKTRYILIVGEPEQPESRRSRCIRVLFQFFKWAGGIVLAALAKIVFDRLVV